MEQQSLWDSFDQEMSQMKTNEMAGEEISPTVISGEIVGEEISSTVISDEMAGEEISPTMISDEMAGEEISPTMISDEMAGEEISPTMISDDQAQSSNLSLPGLDSDSPEQNDNSDDPALSLDFLKMPTASVDDAGDFLNISTSMSSETQFSAGTMELDIRATSLFKGKKKKPGKETIQEALDLAGDLSPFEGVVIVKHALNYDFISTDDARTLLDLFYDSLSQGEATDNLAVILLQEGLVTKFQFPTLKQSLEKDQKARRLPNLDVASRDSIEAFLGLAEDKRVMRVICPHCKAVYRVRVSLIGGKFKCGKCQNKFFLSAKK